MEGDPLFMNATVAQHSLHRPTQRWIRLLQKQGLVVACQSSASCVQKTEVLGPSLLLPLPSLLGYMAAEISFLGRLYFWSLEEDLGSWKPTQHRKREKQLSRQTR